MDSVRYNHLHASIYHRLSSGEMMAKTIVWDVEIFNNVFLFCGRVLENRNVIAIWHDEPDALAKIRSVFESGCTLVSFNGIKFDTPVTSALIAGKDIPTVKMIANSIIEHQMQPWEAQRRFGIPDLKFDHIDLIEVAPSFVGLKAYGARMHMRWLKDLPFEHDAVITSEQRPDVQEYCINDLDTTEELYKRLKKDIELRIKMGEEYGIDFRSKSDTQMAEAAFIKRLNLSRNKPKVPDSITYELPSYISFGAPHLQELCERIQATVYPINQKTGHVELPEFLGKEVIALNSGTYQLGVGGIHSTHDKKVCYVASKDYIVTDIDAESYYPNILLNCNLIPRNTGKRFIDEYREVVNRRVAAKRSGDKATADTLKISVNGTFGKTASRWSPLYSPDLMLAITLTGQLTLLMLIERLEKVGAVALSANTDGIAMGYPAELKETVERVVSEFSELSNFTFEYTPYRTLAMKDVNNYIAVKTDRKVKAKGIYAPLDLKKNPTAPICAQAVCNWLAQGTPFMETIGGAPFTEFISARSVTGGAVQGGKEIYHRVPINNSDEYASVVCGIEGGEHLGKVVRWYYSSDELVEPIRYKANGHKVPKTDGARACMIIENKVAHPSDLAYNWYLKEAISIAINVGCKDFLTDEQIALVTPPPKVKKPRKVKS